MAEGWKTIRVFISSTFRDMHAERDHLINVVFPELEERMATRHLRLRPVDLRWGVLEEEDSVQVCLDIIEDCRPYFIGLIGNRYGSVPPPPGSIAARTFEAILRGEDGYRPLSRNDAAVLRRAYRPSELSEEYVLAVEAAGDARQQEILRILERAGMWGAGHSITAMEILRGVLDDPKQRMISFFYARNPEVSERIPQPDWAIFNEADPILRKKLELLKQRIERESLSVRGYECAWDGDRRELVDLDSFGQMVLDDLWRAIDAEYPPGHEAGIDPLAEEREAMEYFVETRTEHFVGRRDFLERLHDFVRDRLDGVPGTPGLLCLVGEPGSGKTSLMARFYREYRDGHPDHAAIAHFVGASPASTDVQEMLGRLWGEVSRATGVVIDRPQGFRQMVHALPRLLEDAASVRPLCLVIDGINQLEDIHGAREMRWLPEVLPPGMCVVVSTQEGDVADALRRRGTPFTELALSLLSEKEAEDLIDAHLRQNLRKLSPDHVRDLVGKSAARNPLYLLVALEDLRTTGRFETLGRHFGGCREHGWLGRVWSCRRMDRVRGFFDRRGRRTIFLARFVGFLRPLAPFAAGAVGMPYRPFLAYNVAGAIVWGTGTVLAGYFLGPPAERFVRSLGVWTAVVAVAVTVFLVLRHRRRARTGRIVLSVPAPEADLTQGSGPEPESERRAG